MCWSAEVSILTYVFNLVGCCVAWYSRMVPINVILFLNFTALIQLVEFFLWISLDKPVMNTAVSYIGLVLILLQPFVSVYLFTEGRLRIFLLILYSILTLIWLPGQKVKPFTKISDVDSHLEWNWFDGFPRLFAYIWMTFFTLPILYNRQYLLLFSAITTLAMSLFQFYRGDTWKSLWCWSSNFTWLFFYAKIIRDLNQRIGIQVGV